MNYAGKFDAALSLDGQGSTASAHAHIDSFTAKGHGNVPADAFVVPDPNFIFHGEFKRAGVDLVLSNDGHEYVVHDYFKGEKRAAIASPDGAHLTGDVVSALAGYVQYAQAAPGADAAHVIGHVTKMTGSATAIRNGVSIILNQGDNVEKGDVVSTSSDSTLGITFIDGTVFGLSANARMVLNEMVYDPNGSNNSSLLSLVAGTITFVAGETAKHGEMKVDTPVATMGIRGTAVVTELSFFIPQPTIDNPQPQPQPTANFQVLVEPDGHTGSYILFDKITLLPIATVNEAGKMIQISGGNVSVTNALLSPDVQKLITDVFTLKFTDNSTNTKLTTNFTDTITPDSNGFTIKTASGATVDVKTVNTGTTGNSGTDQHTNDTSNNRIPGGPKVASLDLNNNPTLGFSVAERDGNTNDTTDLDSVGGRITFLDFNLGDAPTVKVNLANPPVFTYKDAGQNDVTASLSALQKQDIAATEVTITLVPASGNNNNGSAIWTYSIPDNLCDFLAAGETLTLNYVIRVDNNFAVNNEFTEVPITITITGTNDKPVITTSVPTIEFSGGTSVPGGPLTSGEPTSGTLTFTDVDLTDTHAVSVAMTASLPGGTVPPGPLAAFENALSVWIANNNDSTGTGTGTINWSLADLPVYLADFIPKDELLTLTYTVTVTDEQGATSTQTITVTIKGTDSPAVVWIATAQAGSPPGGLWKDAANWETGTVPTINDDVIVITDQLHGLTPSYPVTIDTAAFAKSLTMNDFGGPAPEIINNSTLTIAGTLNMSADSILSNTSTGTISVGGKAEILDTSTLTNAGTLTLLAGGDFGSQTDITNSGLIDLSGGTLNLLADVANVNGTIQVDSGAKLVVDAATIDHGTVTISGTLELDGASVLKNGTLDNSGAVNAKGTVGFDNETVNNGATGVIEVLANGALTIDQGSMVTNTGNVTVDANGKLTVNGSTIDGAGTVTDNGEIDLTGSAVLKNGQLSNNAAIKVSGTGNALHNETVTANNELDVAASAVLALDLGTSIANTQTTVDGTLTLDTASITGGTVTNHAGGEIDLNGSAFLQDGTLDNAGKLKVTGTGNALHHETVTANNELDVAASAVLALDLGTSIANTQTTVDGTLTLNDASISGGAINGSGTIDVTGTSTIDGNATLSTSFVTADAQLTLDNVTVSGSVITDNASIELDHTVKLQDGAEITGAAVNAKGAIANNGTLEISGSATLRYEVLTNASGAAVSVDVASTLDLADSTIAGGELTVSGTLESTGTSAINDANITNTGTINVTNGTLTIDPAGPIVYTLTNQGLVEANGGEIDVIGDDIVNSSATLEAINAGTLKLTHVTVTNSGGAVSIDGTSKLYLSDVRINDGTLGNAGHLYSVSDSNTVTAAVTNTGAVEVLAGTLDLAGGLSGVGSLIIDDGATLELAGATAQTVTFAGGTDTLQLDHVAGQSFTGTIKGQSSTDGTFNITGDGNITTTSGDALDFTAAAGTVAADIVLTPTGTLTGAARGISVTQNGAGDISLTATKDITGQGGDGIRLFDSATGSGDITVTNLTGKATGTGANSEGLRVENQNAGNNGDITIKQLGGASGGAYGIDAATQGDGDISIEAGGNVTGSSIYGIRARSYGSGSETVTTDVGTVVTSGSSGIVAVNRALAIDEETDSEITVNAYGTINSGSSNNQNSNAPAGIQAGYTGDTNTTAVNAAVFGTVIVNNYASITAAAGYGIHAYNFGNGDVTVNDEAGTSVTGAGMGIRAQALSGGTGDVTVDVGANAHVTGTASYAILAYSVDAGDIGVSLSSGDVLSSGSSGIVAINYATAIADAGSTIHVTAHGTIHSGSHLNENNTTPGGIIAGYNPGGNGVYSGSVNGDVTVESDASITADAGYGIEAFTWGVGNVTVTTDALSSITAAGTAIGAFDHGGGDVNVTNRGSATGAVGLGAYANGAGDVTIDNEGGITGTSSVGIIVTQNESGATGSTYITNAIDGAIVGASGHAAIYIQENTTGSALIDNAGTIGPDAGAVTSSTYAIVETGGAITIDNFGDINGNISVASATFDNHAGGTWTVSGTSVFGAASLIDNAGQFDLHGASISGTGLGIDNHGDIDSWGTASISGTITNTGAIEVDGGTLTLFGSLSGSGSVTIDEGATLQLDGSVSQSTITFSGSGASELQIDTQTFGGSIAGLAATDKLDLSSIEYGPGTYATWVSNGDHTGGVLTVTDADHHSISLTLIGDYSNAHFAGSNDGTGHTLITLNAADDAPSFAGAETSQSASVSELPSTTDAPITTTDPSPAATGTIHFTDVDLTDRPTATISHQSVSWSDTDHNDLSTSLTQGQVDAIENALTLQQSGNANNGAVGWTYSVPDGALDFLGEGQTVQLLSTITLDDHQGHTDTAQVTVNISGANDAPTVSHVTSNYMNFDGHTIAVGAVPTTADDGVTLDGWVNWNGQADPGDSQVLFYNGNTSTAGFGVMSEVNANGTLELEILAGGVEVQDTGIALAASQWHNIALTRAGGTFTLYVDGNAAYTQTNDVNPVDSSPASYMMVGAATDSYSSNFGHQGFTGSMADVSVWTTALTQAQIQSIDFTALTGSESGLAAYYAFNDGSGTTAADTVNPAQSLTIQGSADWASGTSGPGGAQADLLETNGGLLAHGVLALADADATDHVTISVSQVHVDLDGVLQTDSVGGLSTSDFLGYLTVPAGDILDGTGTHTQLTWNFDSQGHAFDFLAAGQTLSLQYTIVPNDGHSSTGTGNGVVIVNIAGTNDAPVFTGSDLASTYHSNGDAVAIAANVSASDIDSDNYHGGSLTATVTAGGHEGDTLSIADNAFISVSGGIVSFDADGAGSGAAVAIGALTDGINTLTVALNDHATDAAVAALTQAIQFQNSLSNPELGSRTVTFTLNDGGGTANGGHDSATFDTTVEVAASEATGPVIDTTSFTHDHTDGNTDIIYGLHVVDNDATAPNDTFTVTANTAQYPASHVEPHCASGSLDDINAGFAEGVTYIPGDGTPQTDQITLTVADSVGHSDTVNFIFNEFGDGQGLTLEGTSGKDVIFATESCDTLIGGAGKDQFVFQQSQNSAQHTINDFAVGEDKIDLHLFNGIDSFNELVIAQQDGDTLVTLDEHQSILLKNVVSTLHASDFIISP